MSTISTVPTIGRRASAAGGPASTVAMALPWTSGPDISDPSVVEVVDASLSRSASVPTTTILPRNASRGHASVEHLRSTSTSAACPAGPRSRSTCGPRRTERPGDSCHLGGHDREALEAVDLVGGAPDRAVRVERHQRAADARADVADDVVAAEHVRRALVVDRRRGEHDVVGVVDRVDQRVVVVVVGRLGVLEVDRDRARLRRRQPVDQVAPAARAGTASAAASSLSVGSSTWTSTTSAGGVIGPRIRKRASTVSSSRPRPTPTSLHHAEPSTAASAATASSDERARRVTAAGSRCCLPARTRTVLPRAVLADEDRPALDLNNVLSQRSSTIHFVPVLTALP